MFTKNSARTYLKTHLPATTLVYSPMVKQVRVNRTQWWAVMRIKASYPDCAIQYSIESKRTFVRTLCSIVKSLTWRFTTKKSEICSIRAGNILMSLKSFTKKRDLFPFCLSFSSKQNLKVREHNLLGPYVDGLSHLAVSSYKVKPFIVVVVGLDSI